MLIVTFKQLGAIFSVYTIYRAKLLFRSKAIYQYGTIPISEIKPFRMRVLVPRFHTRHDYPYDFMRRLEHLGISVVTAKVDQLEGAVNEE